MTREYSLRQLIRFSDKYRSWRNDVIKERGGHCEKCGSNKEIHVHHEISFGKLCIDFTEKYSWLDKVHDKSELLELSVEYDPFWNMNKVKVLCIYCHDECHPNKNLLKQRNRY